MNILLTGSIAYDYLMTFPGYFKDHILPDHIETISLSFLVDSMTRLRGGIAPNIAYTMALLGERPRVWATVGEDFEEYRAWLESQGVDTSGVRVIPGEFTASFFANIDRSNAQIASFYPGAMAHAAELSLHEIEDPRPDLVLISPNDPGAMRRYVEECREMGLPFIYDPSQQIVRLSPEDLQAGAMGAQALFVNEYEAALIHKSTGLGPEDIVGRDAGEGEPQPFMVVTRGEQGADIHAPGVKVHVPVVPPVNMVDPTGVGDAFRGGFLTGYSRNFDWETCGKMGALAATYCLEHRGTQSHHFTVEEFVSRFNEHFGDRSSVDELLSDRMTESGR